MLKLVVSPLFLGLLVTVIGQGILARQWPRLNSLGRAALLLTAASTLGMVGFSFPAVGFLLQRSLEAAHCPPAQLSPGQVSAVVVLSGGAARGLTPQGDQLVRESVLRVERGVAVFESTRAESLIFSGASSTDPKERDGQLMRELALALRVPGDRIRLETASTNTRGSPVEVLAQGLVQSGDSLAVVTSGWHLNRAMAAFKRFFPQAVAVPTECTKLDRLGSLRSWIPSTSGLARSTTMLQEYIGRAWYALRHALG